MPKVSVIIPTYNRAHLLPACLKSVLAQSFREFEIIVIDDGSTDNTSEIISAFPVRYYYQENQGVVAALNHGIKSSSSDYITILGSDDMLMKNTLEKVVNILDKHPEVGFAYGQMYLMDERGRIFKLEKAPPKHSCIRDGKEEIRDLLLYDNHFPSSVVIRRRCLDEVGVFDPSFRSGCEDVDLLIRLAKRYAVAYIAEPLVRYRCHSQNFSSTLNLQVVDWEKSKTRILEDIFGDAELGQLFSDLKRNAYSSIYLTLAGRAYDDGEMKLAREYLFRALKTNTKGFFKSMWLPWLYYFAKSWMPMRFLIFAHNIKRRLNQAMFQDIDQT